MGGSGRTCCRVDEKSGQTYLRNTLSIPACAEINEIPLVPLFRIVVPTTDAKPYLLRHSDGTWAGRVEHVRIWQGWITERVVIARQHCGERDGLCGLARGNRRASRSVKRTNESSTFYFYMVCHFIMVILYSFIR